MTQLPLIWTVLSKSFVNVAMCDKYPAAVLSQALLDRSHCSFGFRIFSRKISSLQSQPIPVSFLAAPSLLEPTVAE